VSEIGGESLFTGGNHKLKDIFLGKVRGRKIFFPKKKKNPPQRMGRGKNFPGKKKKPFICEK